MYSHFLVVVALWCVLSLTNGQSSAPNDTGRFCLDMSALPDYPDTVKRLMDSWSYQSLLPNQPPRIWNTLDLDNDGLTWFPVTGETCREKIRVSEPQNLPQNNWVITQYINKTIPPRFNTDSTLIYINISYILDSSCSVVNCYPNFQLLYHLSNESNDAVANHTAGYTLLANVTSLDDDSLHMKTFNFSLPAKDAGFYVGIRDIGANITITRLFVYRLVGPEMQVGLTLFPETPAPSVECVNITGTCVANANTTTGHPPVLTLDPNGVWTYSEDCLCIEGHEVQIIENMKQCQACSPSTYKSMISNMNCQSCPANSQSVEHGASICSCNNEFFRAPFETAANSCTAAPSAPRRLFVQSRTNVTATITWDSPAFDGGRNDLFYNIFYIDLSNFTNIVMANSAPFNGKNYTLHSLEPNTLYIVRVVAENGVSNQSSDSQRRVQQSFRTQFGVAGQVTGVRQVLDMLVEWTLLSDSDRGPITMYQVRFFSSISNGSLIYVGRDTSVYQVNVTNDFPSLGQPVYVEVRGFTEVGPGIWSEQVKFAEVNPLAPSMIASSTTSVLMVSSTTTSISSTSISSTSISSTSISSTSISSTTSSTTGNVVNTRTTTPTPSPTSTSNGGSSPVISIVAVLGGALLIVLLVGAAAFGYFIFRKFIKKHLVKEETDIGKVPLVVYSALSESEDDETRVQINPIADTD